MSEQEIAAMRKELHALREEVAALADIIGTSLGNVAKAANYPLGGGLMGEFDNPKTVGDHFARGLVKTGNR